MQKKHGPVQTAVRPSGSMNRDQFTRFERLPCFSSKTTSFHPFSPPIRRRSTFFFNPLSKITLSLFLTLKPSLNHSRPLVSASLLCPCRTVAAQLRFLPHSLKVLITLLSLPLSLVAILTLSKSQSLSRLYLSPSSPSQLRSQLTLSRSSLPLSLVPVAAHSVPRRRRRHRRLVLYNL